MVASFNRRSGTSFGPRPSSTDALDDFSSKPQFSPYTLSVRVREKRSGRPSRAFMNIWSEYHPHWALESPMLQRSSKRMDLKQGWSF